MSPTTYHELIAAVRGRPVGPVEGGRFIERIETDSREIRRGDLFWPLRGERFDGHAFIGEAASRGALACVVETSKLAGVTLPAIAVQDTLVALWDFASWYRLRFDPLVIGVTGSVGKTTTRHLLYTVLSRRFSGWQNPENFNNHIGLPLSVLSLRRDHEFAVFEMGASRVGDIRQLAEIARPEVGVITRIAPAHLDHFGSLENIARTKFELLESLPSNGFAVVNGDDAILRHLASRFPGRILRVGEEADNDLVARHVQVEDGEVHFCIDQVEFCLPAIGRHHLTAALIAVAVGREIGMEDEEIAAGLADFEAVPGRCRLLAIGDWLVIDDTYNASPASMQAACETLVNWKSARKRILVAGDMLCLGSQTETFHRELGESLGRTSIDQFLAFGPQSATVAAGARRSGMDAGCLTATSDLDTLVTLLDCWLQPGDVVLVKGSRGMHMERVIEALHRLAVRDTIPHPLRSAA